MIDVEPEDVQPGDWATHKFQELDPRKVARVDVEKRQVWIVLLEGTYGPYDLDNYSYRRRTV